MGLAIANTGAKLSMRFALVLAFYTVFDCFAHAQM